MRRTILVAATSSLVLAVAPASALASHNGHHHKRHHVKHHARVHRVIHRRFGDVNPSTPTTSTGTTPSSTAIGTVDSFDGTTLTIKLNSGSTVSGTVTNDTELECTSASSSVSSDVRRDGGGDNSGGSDGQSSQGSQGDQNQSQGGEDDNGQGDDEGTSQSCTTSALTPGASVSGAELKISSAGSVWEKVDLIS